MDDYVPDAQALRTGYFQTIYCLSWSPDYSLIAQHLRNPYRRATRFANLRHRVTIIVDGKSTP